MIKQVKEMTTNFVTEMKANNGAVDVDKYLSSQNLIDASSFLAD